MTPEQIIEKVLAQANDDDAVEVFQETLRSCVRIGLFRAMKAEVDLLCGPKYHPDKASEFHRAGSEKGHAFINGTRESIQRPRVRSTESQEIGLETYRLASNQRGVFEQVVEAISAGMPVRGVEKCFNGAVKRTQASEMWVEKSRAELERLRSRSLVAEDWLAMWIDGVHIGNQQCVVAAIGLHADGTKEVLDFEPGASESAEVCQLALQEISWQLKAS
jgi:putative transposase